nr:agamous-like MADS-box protein AGL61 [Ipomoea batatas]
MERELERSRAMEAGKKTRGRQKIPMRRIEKDGDRFATFSKRRKGFYKKATELCWLSGCDIGIVVTSPTGKMFSFFNPSPESIMRRVFGRGINLDGGELSQAVDEHSRRRALASTSQRALRDYRRRGGSQGGFESEIEGAGSEHFVEHLVGDSCLRLLLGRRCEVPSFPGRASD